MSYDTKQKIHYYYEYIPLGENIKANNKYS